MIAVVRPCVLIAVATGTLLLAACGRGQPAPAKPEQSPLTADGGFDEDEFDAEEKKGEDDFD